ncbi:uncharacterized protein TRAVEDRAFT_163229 [Trametes versicolor FP-101664 SS1]|uniref:uncharacterized protein n=1 Tax=Trametes versicolor (strain FP-101664) TaxID=717944 RepID=UPI0004623580|nr:uncharacterized protein TRAVEDRAFT_163229 [Trametes versicolor FP-101664 SS1]EIW61738.1 hypothetical protein TRAVEDRAFT_163229 [Trametes versicolor FP-101664 SS1]
MLTSLTRAQFEDACRRYVAAHSDQGRTGITIYPTGWSWHEHSYVSGLGYLSRTVLLPRISPSEEGELGELVGTTLEVEDESAAVVPGELQTCKQYVVYSPTFEVPAFYFTLNKSSGSPLVLDQIVQSTLFRRNALPSSDGNTFGLTLPGSNLSLLSQGDHPTLGTPSWYFHPCHTSEVVGEILAASEGTQPGDELLRWMEVWFMVMSNVVDFFAGSNT